MFCPTCGKEFEIGAKFCQYCGTAKPVQVDSAQRNVRPEQNASSAQGTQQMPYQKQQVKYDGFAIGALICGILSIVFSLSVIGGIILGVVAIILANVSARNVGVTGGARAGKICGIIGLIISIVLVVLIIVLIVVIGVSTDFMINGLDGAIDSLDYLEQADII